MLRWRLGGLELQQITAWRRISPARRLELAFQAYQFAVDTVRLAVRSAILTCRLEVSEDLLEAAQRQVEGQKWKKAPIVEHSGDKG